MQGCGEGQSTTVHRRLLAAHPQQSHHGAVAVPVLVLPGGELHPGLVGAGVDGEEGFAHLPAPPHPLCPPGEVQGLDAEPHVVVVVVLAETCWERRGVKSCLGGLVVPGASPGLIHQQPWLALLCEL